MLKYLYYLLGFFTVALLGAFGWVMLGRKHTVAIPQLPPVGTATNYGDALAAVTQNRLGKTAIAPAIAGTWKANAITAGQKILLADFIPQQTISAADARKIINDIVSEQAKLDPAESIADVHQAALRINKLIQELTAGGYFYDSSAKLYGPSKEPLAALNGDFVVKSVFKSPGSGNIKYVTLEQAPDFIAGKGNVHLYLTPTAGFSNTYPIVY